MRSTAIDGKKNFFIEYDLDFVTNSINNKGPWSVTSPGSIRKTSLIKNILGRDLQSSSGHITGTSVHVNYI